MKTIWKYPIEFATSARTSTRANVRVPADSKLLKVGMQDKEFMAWFEVDDVETKVFNIWQFHVVGTGHLIDPDAYEYIDTLFAGAFVWHIYRGFVLPENKLDRLTSDH